METGGIPVSFILSYGLTICQANQPYNINSNLTNEEEAVNPYQKT